MSVPLILMEGALQESPKIQIKKIINLEEAALIW